MKLDGRIKTDFLIYTPVSKGAPTLHQKGYFSNAIIDFEDLKDCIYGELQDADLDLNYPYWRTADNENGLESFSYFLPESSLKPVEKKYRPYTMEDFAISEFVVFREKSNPLMEYHVRYNGYRKYDNVYKVILGNISYTFDDLFEDFELLDSDGNWIPFGVEE